MAGEQGEKCVQKVTCKEQKDQVFVLQYLVNVGWDGRWKSLQCGFQGSDIIIGQRQLLADFCPFQSRDSSTWRNRQSDYRSQMPFPQQKQEDREVLLCGFQIVWNWGALGCHRKVTRVPWDITFWKNPAQSSRHHLPTTMKLLGPNYSWPLNNTGVRKPSIFLHSQKFVYNFLLSQNLIINSCCWLDVLLIT